jgi:hypothetical protein
LAHPIRRIPPKRASNPTLAAPGGISGSTLAFEQRVVQFALPLPSPNAGVFRSGSFGLAHPAQHVEAGHT